jgi:hypothetical protein
MRVVDNNEICPFIQPQYQTIQNPYSYEQPSYFDVPMIKPEEKTAPVNVVVVTGDKNELSGLTNMTDKKNVSGGESINKDESNPVVHEGNKNEPSVKQTGGESNGIIDFAKSFFIKKVDG